MVIGSHWYLSETGFNYVEPVQPPNAHSPGIAGGTSAHICTWEMDNDLKRRDWVVVRGFKRAICKTLQDALNQSHYKQVKVLAFGWNRRLFRDYIAHLEAR